MMLRIKIVLTVDQLRCMTQHMLSRLKARLGQSKEPRPIMHYLLDKAIME